ncbi:MAG: peroxiredoxin [Pseudomonadota bacterium]
MAVQVNDKLPEMELIIVDADGQTKKPAADVVGSGKVVLFSVPGAFTPTCSAKHLPGFVQHAKDFQGKGVDKIVCLAVNDAFVMEAWGKEAGAMDDVVMVADHDASFSKALGLTFDGSAFGLGLRSQRFALVAENGVVTQLFVEEPGAFEVSSAEHVLRHL